MILTRELIMALKPCSTAERIDGFLACFPGGRVTVEACLQANRDYSLSWVVRRLASPAALAVCTHAVEQANTAYIRACDEIGEQRILDASKRGKVYTQAIDRITNAYVQEVARAACTALEGEC